VYRHITGVFIKQDKIGEGATGVYAEICHWRILQDIHVAKLHEACPRRYESLFITAEMRRRRVKTIQFFNKTFSVPPRVCGLTSFTCMLH
jgi:hypothetical protein